ncbi:MAG: DNA (cytosine-5-)-methyltransferase [Phenylobacterium zucineum]|nr:MAG: DNA (cytosine-5-)-methyltransferase [Phenylobacterium zucineum]
MARLGLGEGWSCTFANDIDSTKAATYRANFPDADLHLNQGDVWGLTTGDLPGRADLAWASSPCQDFSLAGGRAGLAGGRSSAFYGFWNLIEALAAEGRAPRMLVIENVTGLLTSNGGGDFIALCRALADQGYEYGALELDAAAFLPQSRPRVFVIAVHGGVRSWGMAEVPRTAAIARAYSRLPPSLRDHWIDWPASPPRQCTRALADLVDPDLEALWHRPEETAHLITLMSPKHQAQLEALRVLGDRTIGTLFRRTRQVKGHRQQRAEVRFDGRAGCLRTPGGGSSRQTLILVERGQVRSRLISPREAARLMGLADTYRLPTSTTAALHIVGDGVAVPVVRWLAQAVIEPLLSALDADAL